jgi:molybdenum cofactor sulfurtransferase
MFLRAGSIRRRHGPKVYTLLDAAALATTSPVDFSDHENAPDFTSVSFYKIFGYPDLGALIVRKASSEVLLQRKCFYGGTVDMVITLDKTWHALKDSSLHDRLEDGTLPFHNIVALGHAIDKHIELFGSMKKISLHTGFLTRLLFENLLAMKHANGRDVCVIYNEETAMYGNARTQGATIAFNIRAADGSLVGYADVERLADRHKIALRSGSLCNPGGFAQYLGWTATEMEMAYAAGHRCSDATQIIHGKATGVVRVSMGAMSSITDVQKLLSFITANYVDAPAAVRTSADEGARSIANTALSSERGSAVVDAAGEKSVRVRLSEIRPKRASVERWSKRMSMMISPRQMARVGAPMAAVA